MTRIAPPELRDLQDRDIISIPLDLPPLPLAASGIPFHGLEHVKPLPMRAWAKMRRVRAAAKAER